MVMKKMMQMTIDNDIVQVWNSLWSGLRIAVANSSEGLTLLQGVVVVVVVVVVNALIRIVMVTMIAINRGQTCSRPMRDHLVRPS